MQRHQIFVLIICGLYLNSLWAFSDVRLPAKDKFFFGISNAPSQVEDDLSDIWMDFARAGHIPAFDNYPHAEDRIRFWTEPEKEIALAKELGVQVFRLGVDWQRIVPREGYIDWKALEHYKYILKLIKKNDMKVMLTLFHHTEPGWTFKQGSWRNKKMVEYFRPFWTVVLDQLGPSIDYLCTFNEAQVYVLMTQVAGLWPHLKKPNALGIFNIGPFKGRFERSLRHMAQAHKEIYAYAKGNRFNFPIGIAHNVGYYYGKKGFAKLSAKVSWSKFNYKFPDLMANSLDYLGINYYGIEVVKGLGVQFDKDYEYSDSGRGIFPDGLYLVLKKFHSRYNIKKKHRSRHAGEIPFIITENGIADGNDWFRSLYIAEHLAAVSKAMSEGVQVQGYIHWTLTDNFEWGDGYCPKFGLSGIDRNSPDFKRLPRESFYFYKKVIDTGFVSAEQRAELKYKFQSKIGLPRPMCRLEDGVTPLKEPRFVPVRNVDWTFHY